MPTTMPRLWEPHCQPTGMTPGTPGFGRFFFLVDFLGVENYPVRIHPQPVEWVVENP